MRRWIFSFALVAILGLCSAGQAKADGVDTFTFTSGGDVYSWTLMVGQTPDNFGELSPGCMEPSCVFTEFDLANYTLNMTGQGPAILDFFAGPGGGGFELSLGTNSIILDAEGAQIYGGSEMSPTFSPGSFTLTNQADGTLPGGSTGILKIAGPTAAPEPASLALLGVGLLTIAGIVRRKRAAQ